MAEQSTLYQLLREKLGEDPIADIGKRRQRGETWRKIELAYLLDYQVSITSATLRAWYSAAAAEPPAQPA